MLSPCRRLLLPLFCALLAGLALWSPLKGAPARVGGEKSYLFCFWNVEDLFDDRFDKYTREPDRSFDAWFAEDAKARAKKYENLRKVLLRMNGGRGPDVLAVAEVESYWAAELLQKELNANLKDRRDHYTTALYKDPVGGRNIACALITRLGVDRDRTRLLGKRQRILEAHLKADGRQLVVVASHWGSRLKDKGTSRAHYADQIYGRYKAMYKSSPEVAFLACGDFNDNPTDVSVTSHLHATGDLKKVLASRDEPLLFNLFAEAFTRGEGTHYYRGKAHVFDQIVVSPGLLRGTSGWSVDPRSAQIVREISFKGRPDRFGDRSDGRALGARGASDHFPVTVVLKVRP